MRRLFMISVYLCIAVGIAFGQATPVPDQIFYNGKIITVDSAFHTAEAFAVQGENFFAVGSNAEVRALAGPKTRLVDLRGHAVMPGLMDNHVHLYAAALLQYRGVDLVGVPSLAELLSRLREAVAKAKPGETIFTTGGWNENSFPEKRGPRRQELDEISSDHPILAFPGRNAVYVNSAALKAAGISRDTQTIVGDFVEKDPSGEPSGYFNNPAPAVAIYEKLVPLVAVADLKEMIRKKQSQLSAWGITSIREVEVPPVGMRAFQSLLREGTLALRVNMGLRATATQADQLDEILGPWGVVSGFGGPWLRLDSVGEFGLEVTGHALLREPYLNRNGERGAMRIPRDKLIQAMLTMNRHGWRPAPHIMGDGTLDNVLDAYEAADAQSSIRDRRWVVEHIPMVNPDQMDRLARLGVVVSAQAQSYNGYDGAVRDFGKERADRYVPMREMLDHHLVVSTGSDWSGANDDNLFLNIYFYITRKTRSGGIAGAAQKISREEALRVATSNNAYMTFEEKVKGSIEPGKYADFIILSQDIMSVQEDQIPMTRPLATYVGGRNVFTANQESF